MAGKPWYTNGIDEIQRGINDEIPDGYYPGRKPRTQQEKEISLNKLRNTLSKKTVDEINAINQKRSNSLKTTYQNMSAEAKYAAIQKRKEIRANKSDEWKSEYRKKISDATLGKNKGKTPWNKGLNKYTDDRVYKSSKTLSSYMKKYASEMKSKDPEFFKTWRDNINNIMRQNNSFNKSAAEDEYYQTLIHKYGEDDVVRWYSDSRYPFVCDFYIPSEDKFIELNRHWTHGGHPFNENDTNDISKLKSWQDKGTTSKYYLNAIYTWTILDVKKQFIAKENNLNYEAIY